MNIKQAGHLARIATTNGSSDDEAMEAYDAICALLNEMENTDPRWQGLLDASIDILLIGCTWNQIKDAFQ